MLFMFNWVNPPTHYIFTRILTWISKFDFLLFCFSPLCFFFLFSTLFTLSWDPMKGICHVSFQFRFHSLLKNNVDLTFKSVNKNYFFLPGREWRPGTSRTAGRYWFAGDHSKTFVIYVLYIKEGTVK